MSGDASNAMGTLTAQGVTPGDQTSHNWAASDTNPAAGASAPSDPKFYGTSNYSGATVSCARCHDPHGAQTADARNAANPKLLKLGQGSADAMCIDCHKAWDTTNANAFLTHPLVKDYPTFQSSHTDKFKPFTPNGSMALENGLNIVCSTCHGTHYSDSNATTPDGAGQAISAGDGYMLKGSGRLVDPSGICNSCHIYKNHGASPTSQVGCLDCHSGHSYNSGTPNFFVLRNNVSLTTWPVNPAANPGTNLLYTSADYPWRNAGNGYCEGCHTLPTGDHNGAASTGGAADCSICHKHYDATKPNDPAFAPAGGCNTCHGYPPVQTTAGGPNGYAVDGAKNYSTDPNYKLESNTAHAKHAGGTAPQYVFSCSDCHAGNTHDSGTFQDVFNAPNSFVTAGGALAPAYAKTGNGTCSAVYCHSNGGARAAAPVAATVPAWVGGATTCSSCHGNNAATMTASGNSATHQKHLAQGYSCVLCHKDTAANATTLAAGAVQGKHVNGTADVVFDGSALTQLNGVAGAYNANGTCQTVYCHSNGANVAAVVAPDWDAPSTVVCGSCHDVTGQNLTAAHSKHVFDADGPKLVCTTCHTNNGSGADHVDGFPSMVANLQTTVCNSCHGVDGAETAPIWTVPTSADCVTCHSGSSLSTIGTQAPNKSQALVTGHNKATGTYGISLNPAANKTCEDCHDKTATHLTGTGNKRLKAGFDCATCHSTITTHQAKNCLTCHDPHGTTNIYMVQRTSVGNFSGTVVFTKKTASDSYDEADASNGDDICATCHTTTLHNRADATGVAHNEGNVCIPCHLPHTNPGNAFAIGAGTSCDGCHGFPPATAAHAQHNITTADHSVAADRTDCAKCHTGADSYTYAGTGDQPGLNHGNAAGRLTILAASVGYNSTNNNCTAACHTATVANNGVWRAVAPGPLACDACHYYSATPTAAGNTAAGAKALTGTHNQHFNAGKVCTDCHAAVTDLTHNTVALTGTDLAKIQGLAVATQDEATVLGSVGTDVDPGNSVCSNAACHNPSGTTYSATWNGPAATCDLCHSSTNPATNNHSAHLNSATTFGVTIACTDCHANNGTNMAHLNGTVDLTGTKVLGYIAPNCTNDCHQDGRNGVAAVTATWGMPAQANCTICHAQQPATGSHTKHLAASATCADCHDNTVDNTTAAAQHLDLNIDAFDNVSGDLGYPQNKALNTAFTNCTTATNCHTDGRNAAAVATPNWGTAASCTECHSLPMVTGSHSKHLTTSITAIACTACHAAGTNPATDSQPSAGHRDGNVDNNVAIQYGVSPFTNKTIGSAFTTCAAASCHDNGLGVVVATPVWGTAVTDCSQCHLKRPTTGKHSIHMNHSSIAIPSIGCGACHTGAVEGTTFPTTGHFDGNLDVANGYPPNVAKGASTWTGTCSTAVCHTNAQSGNADSGTSGPSVVTTPAWNSTATCGACHEAVPTSAKHSAHLGPYGAQCGSCHATAGNGSAMPTANHLNNSIDVGASAIYTAGGAPGNGWGTCTNSVAGCHPGQTRSWDATGPSCNSCHGLSSAGTGEPLVAGDMLSTNPLGQHNTHVNSVGLGCAICHTGGHNMTSGVTGQDDTIQINFTGLATGGSYNPPAQWTAGKWLYSQASTNTRQECSNIYCHSSGQANGGVNGPTFATPDWGDVATGQCGTCHLGDGTSGNASTIATGSHTKHIAAGASCNTCHAGNTHVNQLIDVTNGTYTAAGSPGNGYGTCSTASCHENGASSPAVLVTTPTWGTSVVNCTECHAGSAIATGSHSIHLSSGATCTSCHASGTNPVTETAPSTGHRNGSINTLASLGYGNSTKGGAYSTCATASCHVTNRNPAGVTPVWGVTPAITNCTECHTTPPTGDTHNTHLNAKTNGQTGLTIGCTDCHDAATNVSTQTPPATGHKNGIINATGGYPAKLITDATYKSCNAALCHQTGQAPASYVTTSNFNINDANCTQCHANGGLSLSHPKHIATNDCSACHTGAIKDTSYTLAAHGDGNVDVAVGGYPANKAYGSAKQSCAAISCHSDGLTGAAGSTPVWGTAGVGCAACHNDNLTGSTLLVTGSHDEHLQSAIMSGIVCADCHTNANPATSTPSATHANGTVEVIGYATANAAIGQGSWTTCSNVSCHDNGTGVKVTTPTWSNTTITNCSECHANAPTTNAHGTHLAMSGVTCGTCHAGAVQGSNPGANHLNGLVDVLFGYTDNTKGTPYGSCGTASCHNNGLGVSVPSPLWNQTANCNTCHTTPPATGSHTAHLTNTEAGTISCGNCHSNATTTTAATGIHANNNVDVFDVTSGDLGYPATRALGSSTWTTCNAASCHDNGTGTLVTTPNWGTSAACTECHTTVPATAAHTKHLTQNITKVINCTDCHAGAVWGSATPTTGHRDGNLDVTGGYGYPANVAKGGSPYDTCTTTYCHGNAMPSSSVSGTTNAPNWGATSTGCTFCHDMPPTAISSHGSVTLATQCKSCHTNVNAAGDGFIDKTLHINGVVDVTGGDSCDSCHANIGSGLSGAHARHVTTPYVGKLSTNDYGNNANGWNRYSNTGGVYDIGCGYCHPSTVAGHKTKQTSLSPTDPNAGLLKTKNSPTANYNTTAAGKCSAVYCHSDGTAANLTAGRSLDWFAPASTNKCNECHTNSPTSNAHSVHTVGIHYTDLYDSDRNGIMAINEAHGSAAMATTITCTICHSATVNLTGNDKNDVCSACHGSTSVKGDLGIAATSTTHLNGIKDVSINLTGFKSKAQLRDDITQVTELNNSWTRTNNYKQIAGDSYDQSKTVGSFTAGTCSAIACHNGNSATWTDPVAGNCQKCHTTVPK